ncbi:MAG: molybdopterin oxidoreductase family protein [Myxococcales bacterium]|nr:molybdopterin oxidoreductase family protein [Myxococcales bacterium]
MCGISIAVEGDRIVAIRGDADDPFSRGHICPKAAALQDIHEDPQRLRHPLRRRPDGGHERVGWDEALAEVAGRLRAIQGGHGRSAVGVYVGNPTVHNYGSLLFAAPFIKALGTRNVYSATSVDQLPHHLAALEMFGHLLLLPIPDLDRTDHLIVLGANPAVSNGSLMSAPGVARRLAAIRARGGKLIVVDPRRSETARLADSHHFIRPGTDALLLAGMLHTLFAEGLTNPGRLAAFTDGLADVERALAGFAPERVCGPTGLDAATIRGLARELAAARTGAVYGRVGVSLQEFGAVSAWLINVLNVVTGNLDRPGGVMFTRPAFDVVEVGARLGQRGHFDRGRSRVRGLPEFNGEYPVATLADEILTAGAGQIRGMVTLAGNPVLSTPNGRRLDAALAGLDFMVSIDLYLNETTRHAHIILPPTGPLEHDNYDVALHALAIRNTAKYSPPCFEPAADTRHDWQILGELAARLGERGRLGALLGHAKRALLGRLAPHRILDLGLRLGPYGGKLRPGAGGLSLRALREQVHGVDLGPLEPCLPARLFTASRRVSLAPPRLVGDLARVEARLLDAAANDGESVYDLRLIGRRHLRSNNSWLHNSLRLVKGPPRCTALLHPDDAARRGITAGQRVVVRSRVGSIELPVELSDEVMPGVVSVPHGWGHDRPGVALATAQQHAGASVNDLTDDRLLDALSGNAALNGVPVRVDAAPPRAP